MRTPRRKDRPIVHPRVDILINSHNYAGYLGAAIDSALAQTHPAARVIVVDDGSTDGSAEIIRSYGHRITADLQGERRAGLGHERGHGAPPRRCGDLPRRRRRARAARRGADRAGVRRRSRPRARALPVAGDGLPGARYRRDQAAAAPRPRPRQPGPPHASHSIRRRVASDQRERVLGPRPETDPPHPRGRPPARRRLVPGPRLVAPRTDRRHRGTARTLPRARGERLHPRAAAVSTSSTSPRPSATRRARAAISCGTRVSPASTTTHDGPPRCATSPTAPS